MKEEEASAAAAPQAEERNSFGLHSELTQTGRPSLDLDATFFDVFVRSSLFHCRL